MTGFLFYAANGKEWIALDIKEINKILKERRITVKKILVASLMTTLSIPMSTVEAVVRTIEKMFV